MTEHKPSSSEAQAVPRLPITCSDLERFDDKPPCCNACHEYNVHAETVGYFCRGGGDCDSWNVCCVVGRWLNEAGLDTYSERDARRVFYAHRAAKLQQPPERLSENTK